MKTLLQMFVCTLTLVAIASTAFGASMLECGKEYRFVTKDGVKYEGSLWGTDDSMLILKQGTTIAFSNVESAYRLRRHTMTGAILGGLGGAAIGFAVAKRRADQEDDAWVGYFTGETISRTTSGAVIGAGIGCMVGAIIGHFGRTAKKVRLDFVPLCASPSGEIVPLKLNLSFNF